jgi:DinB superfamily
MPLSHQIANHFRGMHSGDNYTGVNLHSLLVDVTLTDATNKIHSLNSIAALTYHINYYVSAVLKALQGGALDAHDKYSYDCPPLHTEEDWQQLKNKLFADAELFASLVEELPEQQWNEHFIDGKYGTWYRNIAGVIEHTHYHMGQIALIKKMMNQ